MASGQTTNYQLNQWEAEDKVLRTDFNTDNAKVDAALAAHDGALAAHAAALEDKLESGDLSALEQRAAALEGRAQLVTGTYVGDGTDSRLISLGFAPKAVLVLLVTGATANVNDQYGGLALPDCPVTKNRTGGGGAVLEIEGNGIRVHYDSGESIRTNQENAVYYYLAWK